MSAPPPSYHQSTDALQSSEEYTVPPARAATVPPCQVVTTSTTSDSSTVSFTLNGKIITLDAHTQAAKGFTGNTKLIQYLRTTKWTGTKLSCNEGGCGACLVALTFDDPVTGATTTRAINACLRPLFSCNGMSITTNDGLGTPKNPHPMQEALAAANGSQCGFCSNGIVMNLYALMSQHPQLTKLQIERAYDGNLCRCTGYRQILKAMKSFGSDAKGQDTFGDYIEADHHHGCDEKSCLEVGCKRRGEAFPELEDLDKHVKVPESVKTYNHQLPVPHRKRVAGPTATSSTTVAAPPKLTIHSNGTVWQDCPTIADLEFWLNWYTTNNQDPMLVVAQTSLAVYPKEVAVKLSIALIPELNTITQSPTSGVTVGPNVPIADLLTYLQTAVGPHPHSTDSFSQAVDHLGRVASVPIRNIASVGGNLMVCHNHSTSPTEFFPSDVVILLMGLGATVSLKNATTSVKTTVNMTDFFTTSFSSSYITAIIIPWTALNEKFMTYKISIRQVNSHAIVNAAMRCVVDPTTHIITGTPTIAYGGVFTKPTRMTAIEAALASGTFNVTSSTAFQTVCTSLTTALVPAGTHNAAFRVSVALSQFYKFFLFLQPGGSSQLETAEAPWFTRPESTGSTIFTPDPTKYPVDIGMTKVEAIQQTTGNAKYTDDLGAPEDTLYCHLVLADQGNCTLTCLNHTVATTMPGFVAFYTAADLPQEDGRNVWADGYLLTAINSTIDHAGHALGIMVATTAQYAEECAKSVIVSYADLKTNIVTLPQAIAAGSIYDIPAGYILGIDKGDASGVLAATPASNKVTATAEMGWQFHFHMESQACFIIPREDVVEVFVATQGPVYVQEQIAKTLGVPMSKIIVQTKRCGGGYGGKVHNSVPTTTMAAFVATKLQVPVKLYLPQEQNVRMLGPRGSRYLNYTVSWDDEGKFTALEALVTAAGGANGYVPATLPREAGGVEVNVLNLDNCYLFPNMKASSQIAITHTPPSSSCRGPGWVPAVGMAEMIISKVAQKTGKTQEEVRARNFFKKGDLTGDGVRLTYWDMPKIWSQLMESSGYTTRRANVTTFNAANRWIKRGLAIMPCRFGVGIGGSNFDSIVNIYGDGTIGITIGGIEIGQGINTKVIQVAALKLGLTKEDLSKITVNESCTRNLTALTNITGGSVTSDLCCLSVMHACETLNLRLAPFRQRGQSWSELIGAVEGAGGVQLTATGWTDAPGVPNSSGVFNYNSTSAAVCEVTLDCLSGEYEIRRVDILFDCGISINPVIDVGQVQGGFVFGQGYFTQEEVRYCEETGANLTPSTWEYKPPSAYDVPIEFNVTLLGNTPNPMGVLGSKVSGEPPTCLSAVVVHALEDAISACLGTAWVCEKTPLTVPDIQTACASAVSQFSLS